MRELLPLGICTGFLEEGDRDGNVHEEEEAAANHDGRLERLNAAKSHQSESDSTHEERPHHTNPNRRFVVATNVLTGGHGERVRATVNQRQGGEEAEDEEDNDRRRAHRKGSPRFDNGASNTVLFDDGRNVKSLRHQEMDRVGTEDRPNQPGRSRHAANHSDRDFTHRTTARDAGEEEARLDREDHPPGPVEDRPALREARTADRVRVEHHAAEVVQENANGVGEVVDREAGSTNNENPSEDENRQVGTKVRGELHTLFETEGHANGVNDNPSEHDASVEAEGMRDTEEPLHAFRNQRRGKAETGTHGEQQSDEVEVVDQRAEEALRSLLTDHGFNRAGRTNNVNLLHIEEVTESNRKEAEGRPGHRTPVEHGVSQTGFDGFRRHRSVAKRRLRSVVVDFDGTPEEHSSGSRRREEQEDPARRAEFRRFFTELAVSPRPKDEPEPKDECHNDVPLENPTKGMGDVVKRSTNHCVSGFKVLHDRRNQGHGNEQRWEKHLWINRDLLFCLLNHVFLPSKDV